MVTGDRSVCVCVCVEHELSRDNTLNQDSDSKNGFYDSSLPHSTPASSTRGTSAPISILWVFRWLRTRIKMLPNLRGSVYSLPVWPWCESHTARKPHFEGWVWYSWSSRKHHWQCGVQVKIEVQGLEILNVFWRMTSSMPNTLWAQEHL